MLQNAGQHFLIVEFSTGKHILVKNRLGIRLIVAMFFYIKNIEMSYFNCLASLSKQQNIL